MEYKVDKYVLGILRIALGWIFLFPFLDKMFGLEYTTSPDRSMLDGYSPTYGFLNFGTAGGTFEGFFSGISSNAADSIGVVDILFMAGLLGIGLAFILGIGTRIAGVSGFILMMLMWFAALPFERTVDHNPFMDDHIIYGLLALYFATIPVGRYVGLGAKWEQLSFVKKYPALT